MSASYGEAYFRSLNEYNRKVAELKKIKLTPATQRRWYNMTDENDHRNVRKEIAQFLTDKIDKSFAMYV